MKKNTSTSTPISLQTKLILSGYALVALYLSWQAIRPFLAELHFREAYVENVAATSGNHSRYKFAISDYQKAVFYAPWETQYKVKLGRAYENYAQVLSNKQEKITLLLNAKKYYDEIIAFDDQNPWYLNRLSTVYRDLAKLIPKKNDTYIAKALNTSKKAAALDPNNPLFQLNFAYFLHQLNQLDLAIIYYKKAIEIDDRLLEASFNLADIYVRKNNSDEALVLYLSILEKNPSFKNIHFALGRLYSIQNKPDDAIEQFKEELKVNPLNLTAYKSLALTYDKHGDFKNAEVTYKKILSLSPKDHQIRQAYITVLQKSGKHSLAKQEQQTLILMKQ